MRRDGRIAFEEELARGVPNATILDPGEVLVACLSRQGCFALGSFARNREPQFDDSFRIRKSLPSGGLAGNPTPPCHVMPAAGKVTR